MSHSCDKRVSEDPLPSGAYAHCLRVARDHYENFPVASRLLPARLRPHVAAVYAFARAADDFADEGAASAGERLAELSAWRTQLERCVMGDAEHPVFIALGDTIRRFDIPVQLFHDLLDAFEQDVRVTAYATFDDVLDYCRRSANPVGRIVLALHGLLTERTAAASDALCTGLQLANFWQDVSVDARKPRVYIPEEDLVAIGALRDDILAGRSTDALRSVIRFEVERTRRYFQASVPLFGMVPLRLRLELRAIWHGGMRILDAIERTECDTTERRPVLGGADRLLILLRAFSPVPVHV